VACTAVWPYRASCRCRVVASSCVHRAVADAAAGAAWRIDQLPAAMGVGEGHGAANAWCSARTPPRRCLCVAASRSVAVVGATTSREPSQAAACAVPARTPQHTCAMTSSYSLSAPIRSLAAYLALAFVSSSAPCGVGAAGSCSAHVAHSVRGCAVDSTGWCVRGSAHTHTLLLHTTQLLCRRWCCFRRCRHAAGSRCPAVGSERRAGGQRATVSSRNRSAASDAVLGERWIWGGAEPIDHTHLAPPAHAAAWLCRRCIARSRCRRRAFCGCVCW
jgi:hypothetical protein